MILAADKQNAGSDYREAERQVGVSVEGTIVKVGRNTFARQEIRLIFQEWPIHLKVNQRVPWRVDDDIQLGVTKNYRPSPVGSHRGMPLHKVAIPQHGERFQAA